MVSLSTRTVYFIQLYIQCILKIELWNNVNYNLNQEFMNK